MFWGVTAWLLQHYKCGNAFLPVCGTPCQIVAHALGFWQLEVHIFALALPVSQAGQWGCRALGCVWANPKKPKDSTP